MRFERLAIVRPFQGIVYNQRQVELARVIAPPYDVITPEDRARYYARDPHNVVRLIAGYVHETDHEGENKYTRAATFFQQWLNEGILCREPNRCFYVYRHAFTDPESGQRRARTGLLCVTRLEPFGRTVLAHERTHVRPQADQQSLTQAVEANLSPVFALYQNPGPGLAELMDRAAEGEPRFRIDAEGEGHTIWRVDSANEFHILDAALAGSRLFIADGHHRYETALKYRNRQVAAHPEASPQAAFNYVLMLLVDVDDPQLRILPTHRLVHDMPSLDPRAELQRLQRRFSLTPVATEGALLERLRAEDAEHQIGLVLPGPTFSLLRIPRIRNRDPIDQLDVVALHRDLIAPELGLHEGRLEDERHLAYTRDAAYAVQQVRRGRAQAAFLLRPTRVADVQAVAASGAVMPQKSTYFYPKPASGIVFNSLSPKLEVPDV